MILEPIKESNFSFIYTDFDQMMLEVVEFDETARDFMTSNPGVNIQSEILLDLENRDEQVYIFHIKINGQETK